MRDYDSTVKNLREAAKGLLFDAMPYRASVMRDAADAIEELQNQIAEYGKMVDRINGLIEKMQGKADEAREAERYHYGSAGTVSQYTWVHNAKCIHERFVRDLEDLILPLYGEANADS